MVDPTLLQFANDSSPLVIKTLVETNQTQYWISLCVTLLVSFWIVFYLIAQNGGIKKAIGAIVLRYKTGRPTIVVAHNEAGLFSVDMINQKTLNKVTSFLSRNQGKEVNIVLHTPGGSIFHSMAISKAIKQHGKVHVMVPVMAMSGGTLLSLSAFHLHMSPSAVLGPVDPQVGMIWTMGSADDWNKVIKKKGAKAGDTSIVLQNEGMKYTKLIRDHFLSIGVDTSTADMLTNGKEPHGKTYGPNDVTHFGVRLSIITGSIHKTAVYSVT